ncbi:unnamed protein product [Ixodes persulcatus]
MLLILGAILMHATALVLLLEEPRWLKYPQSNSSRSDDQKETVPVASQDTGTNDHSLSHIMTAFCNPMFYIIVFLGMIIHYTHSVFVSMIVDFAMDRGMSLDAASSLIVYSSVDDFVGSLGLLLIADRKALRRSTLVMWCCASFGTCMIFLPIFTSVLLLVLLPLVEMFAATLITVNAVMVAE